MKPIVNGPKLGLGGQYRCVLNKGTDREVDTGWFDNLITNGGLDYLATALNPFQYGSIGTGTATPANGNTSLQAFVAEVAGEIFDGNSNAGTPTFIATTDMHWTYAQGAVVGNMAEVGVGWGAGGTNLFSRALILAAGVPATLTVTSIDQLTVYYRLTATPQLTDLTGSVTLASNAYTYTGRLMVADQWFANLGYTLSQLGIPFAQMSGSGGNGYNAHDTQVLGSITTAPSGARYSGASYGEITLGSYTPGQKYLDSTGLAGPTECNAPAGIGSLEVYFGLSAMQYQYKFAKTSGGQTIPKDNTKTLSLTFRVSWDRI